MNIIKGTTLILLIVSIACAGCYDHKIDPFSDQPVKSPKSIDSKSSSALRAENERLRKEIYVLKTVQNQNRTFLVQISDLESVLASKSKSLRVVTDKFQHSEEESLMLLEQTESLRIKISDLRVMLDTQRAEAKARFKRLENVGFVYEVAIYAQKVTIETLQKLCRLYEASAESE